MYRAKCIVDDLAPESNERIKTAGDYMLRRKQQALYSAAATPLQLTCQNKIVKSSPSFDLLLNYTKGKKMHALVPIAPLLPLVFIIKAVTIQSILVCGTLVLANCWTSRFN